MIPSHILLVIFAAGIAAAAAAQEPAGSVRRDPADSGVAVPRVDFDSPFSGYRRFVDGEIGPWRGVNDEVGRIGGWKVYAREAFEAAEAEKRGAPDARTRPAPGTPTGTGSGGR